MHILRSRPRRDEFVKRFEEITKQEIKKYNDSLLGTHMALDEFRRSLKGCVDYYAKQVASISSVVKKLEAENIDLKQTIKTLEKKITDLDEKMTETKGKVTEPTKESGIKTVLEKNRDKPGTTDIVPTEICY